MRLATLQGYNHIQNFHLVGGGILSKILSEISALLTNCHKTKGSLTLAMGKCLWFSVKI